MISGLFRKLVTAQPTGATPRSGQGEFLHFFVQRLTLGSPLFGFDDLKRALQRGEIADLLVRDLLGLATILWTRADRLTQSCSMSMMKSVIAVPRR